MKTSTFLSRNQDTLAGLLFIICGLAFAIGAGAYDMGSAARMGPGYFPRLLGAVLVLLGIGVYLGGWRSPAQAGGGRFPLRPLLAICAAIAVFAVLLKPAGLALASAALVAVSSFGQTRPRWGEVALAALALTVAAVAVFAYGLKLPLNVWPAW
ncbi:MAG: tripartite tricarboxylate transporter TctB family protein [Rhodocyclaceae bacterium]